MRIRGQETSARPPRCLSSADELERRFLTPLHVVAESGASSDVLYRRTPEWPITGVGQTARRRSTRNLRAKK
jgi:hypothetical protein